MESQTENIVQHCYCQSTISELHMLRCFNCKKLFHVTCLKSRRPSDLAGDIYFKFTCINCSTDGIEYFERMRLHWTTVLMLSLYNLQIQGGGKCGYFRWREQICRFVDKNWTTFFGMNKKKSATWHGTVAGCLSNGANRYFVSGVEVLGETGWWTLKSSKLPSLDEVENSPVTPKLYRKRKIENNSPILEGPRKKNSNILESALSLKEKKTCMVDNVCPKAKKKQSRLKTGHNHKVIPKIESLEGSEANDIPRVIHKIIIKDRKNVSLKPSDESNSEWPKVSDDIDFGIQDLPNIFDLSSSLDPSNALFDPFSEMNSDKASIKSSPKYDSDEENSNSDKISVSSNKIQQHFSTSRKKKAVAKDESPVKEMVVSETKYRMISTYEEGQLLNKIECNLVGMKQNPEVKRLYRKLMVRHLKRERNLPFFDIDAEVRSIRGMDPPEYLEKETVSKSLINRNQISTILDRYQITYNNQRSKANVYSSFITRLMGLEDEHNECIISPYTERILKPYIFRDFSTKPLKLQLLEEIINYSNKSNPNFASSKLSSIDYCYVRPQHIPAINALCQEFFWPGIDLSESLQYPDFSCVVLYRKIIIGFAFMVPDVKYNEAYITFIFCHPDWRRAGIATFMLYHLIQTCMGKDVTLHVSATSSAVFLYQKFGFKVEEFIHNFYDKYLPVRSKECRHALFLRLSR